LSLVTSCREVSNFMMRPFCVSSSAVISSFFCLAFFTFSFTSFNSYTKVIANRAHYLGSLIYGHRIQYQFLRQEACAFTLVQPTATSGKFRENLFKCPTFCVYSDYNGLVTTPSTAWYFWKNFKMRIRTDSKYWSHQTQLLSRCLANIFVSQFPHFLCSIINSFNPLNPELNPICYLLALLGAHHFLHVSRIRVKLLTLRQLMSYIYGAPILDVSRSHTTTQHSR